MKQFPTQSQASTYTDIINTYLNEPTENVSYIFIETPLKSSMRKKKNNS